MKIIKFKALSCYAAGPFNMPSSLSPAAKRRTLIRVGLNVEAQGSLILTT